MNLELLLEVLREAFPAENLEPRAVPTDETFIALSADCIHRTVHLLVTRFDLRHLSTITGEDTGSEISLLYHFWDGQGLTLQTTLPLEEPRIPTITDLVPGASFYEREVGEMLGVIFEGQPDPPALLLPDDWDSGPPLRKQPPSAPTDEGERFGVGEDQEEVE